MSEFSCSYKEKKEKKIPCLDRYKKSPIDLSKKMMNICRKTFFPEKKRGYSSAKSDDEGEDPIDGSFP